MWMWAAPDPKYQKVIRNRCEILAFLVRTGTWRPQTPPEAVFGHPGARPDQKYQEFKPVPDEFLVFLARPLAPGLLPIGSG